MRTAGTIYRQYKYARKLALIRAVSSARSRKHDNCFYGRLVQYLDAHGNEQHVCLCMHKPDDPDICTNVVECNAYANKWSDEDIREKVKAIMEDDTLKKQLFPELWAYEWVLDKSLAEAKKDPKGIIAVILMWCISVLESLLRTVAGKKALLNGGQDAET